MFEPRGRGRSALFAALVFSACGAGAAREIPVAGPADLQRGTARFADLTGAELEGGRNIFLNRCGRCHMPPEPTSRTPESWPQAVHEMRVRARLDANQARLVERYLVTMSEAVPAQSESGSSR